MSAVSARRVDRVDEAQACRPSLDVTPGCAAHKADQLGRLHRIDGQVRGVTRMVEDDRYCIDVLTQISAIIRAMLQVALGLLDDHVRHCVLDAARSGGPEADEKLTELNAALRRALRL